MSCLAGCGGLEALHNMYDILGGKTVFVNTAGCITLLSVCTISRWLKYAAMASAPAGLQGVCDALYIHACRRRITTDDNMEVVVVTGGGSPMVWDCQQFHGR